MPTPWTDADRTLLREIYKLQRTAHMNELYYAKRLGQVQRWATLLEIATAITASGSGVAALTIWQGDAGKALWQLLAVVAAVAAVLKVVLAPSKRVELLTRQLQGYRANYFALKKLGFDISQHGAVTDDIRKRHATFYDRHVQLGSEDEQTPDRVLLEAAQDECDTALPASSFWWPADGTEPVFTPAPGARPGTALVPVAAPAPPRLAWYQRPAR